MIGWIALTGAIGAMARYLLDLGLGLLYPHGYARAGSWSS